MLVGRQESPGHVHSPIIAVIWKAVSPKPSYCATAPAICSGPNNGNRLATYSGTVSGEDVLTKMEPSNVLVTERRRS